MGESGIRSVGDPLEQALREYEAVLAESALGRHAYPDDEEDTARLEEGRVAVIRQSEAIPRACWPRELCGHCYGEREVDVVQPGYSAPDDSTPEVKSVKRKCRRCWGTGLTLNLPSDDGSGSELADGA